MPDIDLRYVIAFVSPITATVRECLRDDDHSGEAVDRMYLAPFRSIVLRITLRSYPYLLDSDR